MIHKWKKEALGQKVSFRNIQRPVVAEIDLKPSHSYSVQVTDDILGTIKFQTSNPDVIICLSILDQERKVASNTGRGHVIIPAFYFQVSRGEHPLNVVREVNKE